MRDIDVAAIEFGVWPELTTRDNPPNVTGSRSLKHSHSLEIPDLEDDKDADPTDFAQGEYEPQGVVRDQEMRYEWLPGRELDENTAVSPPDLLQKSVMTPSSLPSQRPKRRTTRKEQIQDLRNTVTQLSERLQGLRTAACAGLSPISPTDQQVPSILRHSRSLWERMAARQLKTRRKAEGENAKLKDQLAAQRRTARNIRRLIRRREDDELLRDLRNSKRPKSDNNEQVFAKLLCGIDEIYASLDRIHADADMNSVPCPGRNRRIYPDARGGTAFVELSDKNIVPFSFDRAERAVWKFLQGPRVSNGKRVCSKEFQQCTNTSKSCVGFTSSGKGLSSYDLEQRVSRKYVEGTRTVFVSRTIADPKIDKPWFSSMQFCETMTIVLKRGNPLTSGQETTTIESLISVCKCDESAAEQHWPMYVNAAVSGWDRKVSFNSQEIENILFDDINGWQSDN